MKFSNSNKTHCHSWKTLSNVFPFNYHFLRYTVLPKRRYYFYKINLFYKLSKLFQNLNNCAHISRRQPELNLKIYTFMKFELLIYINASVYCTQTE